MTDKITEGSTLLRKYRPEVQARRGEVDEKDYIAGNHELNVLFRGQQPSADEMMVIKGYLKDRLEKAGLPVAALTDGPDRVLFSFEAGKAELPTLQSFSQRLWQDVHTAQMKTSTPSMRI